MHALGIEEGAIFYGGDWVSENFTEFCHGCVSLLEEVSHSESKMRTGRRTVPYSLCHFFPRRERPLICLSFLILDTIFLEIQRKTI